VILTVAQMRAAEDALIAAGSSVEQLMQLAGRGAADWIYRLACPRPVTVLCGPGNNGGDGYVIAESLRARGLPVAVVAPLEPVTEAAKSARAAYGGQIFSQGEISHGAVLVDCLFGSGLKRPLSEELLGLLLALCHSHSRRVAVDLPSGVDSDSGEPLNAGLPPYDLTIALGAWKYAHWTMPASALMGERRLVSIGVQPVSGAARLLETPALVPPAPDAHKYRRGLLTVISGAMPGASLLACRAAMHGGAGYVKLASKAQLAAAPADLVVDADALDDARNSALLVGPGLGRNGRAQAILAETLARNLPTVLDADALVLLEPELLGARSAPVIATPHEGELTALARRFGIDGEGKRALASQLAERTGMVVIAKGPDTMIAGPGGELTIAAPASSWLSTAGTGDVLAGLVASRLTAGAAPFAAACEAVWLHGEAARMSGAAFSAVGLIGHIPQAYSSCL